MFKTVHLTYLGFILFIFPLSLSDDNIQKRIIRDGNYNIECFVSFDNTISPKANKTYFWFKSGEIHKTQSDVGGLVLHKSYKKLFKRNQLIEKGDFNMGLKDNFWKKWYLNGSLKEVIQWNKGDKQGRYIAYDSLGNIEVQGNYKNNMKSGVWISKEKDTILYKKGEVYVKSLSKRLLKKEGNKNVREKRSDKNDTWLKKLFRKKDKKR
ncbi:toxin-antitoxin system YwqK family antitoxin [Olleya sp. HaHaR_3_96]|uniref:toxin-antitoxin system YwqK family antitoxin n=1 Tax=Olleya sp. HaHaR_3_96 TaxID=2745560 RepID=UPI001C4ED5BF|nr:hypothetical protein [Olleya sp. HaHaR_3_96]QXP58395.1 hypothetical protein H0I26_10735 [Olleya sp. HaHaR_3_96]